MTQRDMMDLCRHVEQEVLPKIELVVVPAIGAKRAQRLFSFFSREGVDGRDDTPGARFYRVEPYACNTKFRHFILLEWAAPGEDNIWAEAFHA